MLQAQGQRTFYSPFTQDLENGTTETIERKIVVDSNRVVIFTSTDFGKDIQRFRVKEIEDCPGPDGNRVFYKCVSKDGKFPTIFILVEKEHRTEEILVLQPATANSKESLYRILVDEEMN